MNRGGLTYGLLLVLAACASNVVAQGFPSRSIRIVVPFPPGGPSDYSARVINREIVRGLNLPDVKEKIAAQGNEVIGDSPDHFAKFIRAESDKWGKVVRQAGIKLE